jgi:deoxyribodipyrimidine photo-lyase
MSSRSILWFRRDLRIGDNPALNAALAAADEIVPVFILEPKLMKEMGEKRAAYLSDSLRSLDESLGGDLNVIAGEPIKVLTELKDKYQANSIHISAEYEPTGATRDAAIEKAGIELTRTGSPYAVAPGRVRKPSDDTPYKVYTPFYRAWLTHGWRAPAVTPKQIPTVKVDPANKNIPDTKWPAGVVKSEAGEAAAIARFKVFKKSALFGYDENRNFAAIDGTSKMSAHLSFGEIHPRTLLAELGESKGEIVYQKEIAWREFYADVLFHNKDTETDYYAPQFANMRYDKPGAQFKAWCEGKTGYPFVDAAMRQLLKEGWMHNRTRMVVASFLVKDLHLEWQLGERYFKEHLIDYDVASNAHGWQWTAGCGTDASPYYRVFNPIEQGKRFDEQGDYVRRYIPELSGLSGVTAQEPWNESDGYKNNYPKRIVDHAAERIESLARLEEIKASKPLPPIK